MTTELAAAPDTTVKRAFLVHRFADKYGIEPGRMLETLKQTCFRTEKGITNEQMAALLLVCEVNDLNPFVRMVHALLDKQGNVVPFVGIDGWISLVNRRPEFDGVALDVSEDGTEATCTMWRKDRRHPIRITEYLAETKRGSTPWSTSPRRMLRHRAYAQCARVAFGFPGLHDEATAREIVYSDAPTNTQPERLRNVLQPPAVPPIDDGFDDPAPHPSEIRPIKPQPRPHPPQAAAAVLDDDDEPPVTKSLAAWIDEMLQKADQESAALVVDEGRSLLPPEQHADLSSAYRTKWAPKE